MTVIQKLIPLLIASFPFIGVSQTFLPPNYSFENDTNYKVLSPWMIEGKFYFYTSYNMNMATNGNVFIGIESSYFNDTIYNSKITCKFPIDNNYSYLKFESIFQSQFYLSKFNVKIKFTNTDTLNNLRTVICELDTFIDTSSTYLDIDHKVWSFQEIDLRKHYIKFSKPDTCFIEFNCNINDKPPIDFFQTLFLDNIRLEDEISNITTINTESKLLVLYPNPNNGHLSLRYLGEQSIERLEIYDQNGRCILQSEVHSNQHHLDVSFLPKGVYSLKVHLNSGEIITESIINQ